MSINYVIACWSGMRRINPKQYIEDRPVFLRHHVESLLKLKHGLGQVTFVVADNPDEPATYRKFLEQLPKKIGSADVVVMRRPNVGYSYGAYNDVFKRYGTSFDKYMLMEDDYIFLMDDFDKEMSVVLEGDQRCGFVSFVLERGTREAMVERARKETPGGVISAKVFEKYCPEYFIWPRVAVGLARGEALGSIVKKFGELPYAKGANHTECKFLGQFALPVVFQKMGWAVGDMVPKYRVEAFGPSGERLKYGPPDKPLYISPIQFKLR